MWKKLKFKNYMVSLYQGLNEDDYDRHMEFCEWYIIHQEADINFNKT